MGQTKEDVSAAAAKAAAASATAYDKFVARAKSAMGAAADTVKDIPETLKELPGTVMESAPAHHFRHGTIRLRGTSYPAATRVVEPADELAVLAHDAAAAYIRYAGAAASAATYAQYAAAASSAAPVDQPRPDVSAPSKLEIKWDRPGRRLAAQPGASLSIDRNAWETNGALFRAADDGQGETPRLATASVGTPAGPLTVGILDYGEDTTYILVPGDAEERPEATARVLATLCHIGMLSHDDVVDIVRPTQAISLEQRVADLERQLEQVNQAIGTPSDHEGSKATG